VSELHRITDRTILLLNIYISEWIQNKWSKMKSRMYFVVMCMWTRELSFTKAKPNLLIINIISFVHRWLYSPLLGPGLFFSFVIFFSHSVELLGRVVSPSQGRYLNTGQHKQNKRTHRHPCLQWDSHPRPQCSSERRRFMP
jgi:hypothetical protein